MTRPRWALLTVVALGAAAAFVWLVVARHYRPSLRDGERYGIDVSNHQGDVDWDAVAADEIEFVYVKATEGGDFVDAAFDRNWEGSGDAGLDRGAYHFFTLCRPGADQARNFLRTVPDDAELPPAIDLELPGNCSARPSADDVAAEVAAFVELVEAEMGPVVVYTSGNWTDRYDLPAGDRWLSRWFRRPGGDWYVWQYSGVARIEGIDGDVDLDVMRAED